MSRRYRTLVVASATLVAGAWLVAPEAERPTDVGAAELVSATGTNDVIALRYVGRFANH